MSTCHQAHNIPWNSLFELFQKVPDEYLQSLGDPDVNKLVITADPDRKVIKKVWHFAGKFQAAIQEFSKTEREKYDNKELDQRTFVYEVDACNEFLPEKMQQISGWMKKGDSYYRDWYVEPVKELFIQDRVDSLMYLARKGVPLEELQFVTYSNFFHYGIGRIKEDCLTLYIHLNILVGTGALQEPNKWYGQWRQFLQREILNRYDGNSQSRMFKEYFEKNPKFEDLEGFQSLLKTLFKTLYVYDMVMKERGIKVNWRDEILSCISGYFGDRTRISGNLWYQQCDELCRTSS